MISKTNNSTMGNRKRKLSTFNAYTMVETIKWKLLHLNFDITHNYTDRQDSDQLPKYICDAIDSVRWIEWELYRRFPWNKNHPLPKTPPDIQDRLDARQRIDALLKKLNKKKKL